MNSNISVVVDAVSAVVDIADADIEPPPKFGARLRADLISGMGKLGEQFVILLNVDKVLSVGELAMLGFVDDTREGEIAALTELSERRALFINSSTGAAFRAKSAGEAHR
jgi:hypothetical protein